MIERRLGAEPVGEPPWVGPEPVGRRVRIFRTVMEDHARLCQPGGLEHRRCEIEMHAVGVVYRHAARAPLRHAVVAGPLFSADAAIKQIECHLRGYAQAKRELDDDINVEFIRPQPRGYRRVDRHRPLRVQQVDQPTQWAPFPIEILTDCLIAALRLAVVGRR